MTFRNHFAAVALAISFFAPLEASAGASTASAALALAAIVGRYSPVVHAQDKHLLSAYLNGAAHAAHPKGKQVAVKADSIDCRASNVDITARACTLAFGVKKVELTGAMAHELYATLVENGVPADGAAGTIHEAITNLDCQIDADDVAQKAGGGAHCAFKP